MGKVLVLFVMLLLIGCVGEALEEGVVLHVYYASITRNNPEQKFDCENYFICQYLIQLEGRQIILRVDTETFLTHGAGSICKIPRNPEGILNLDCKDPPEPLFGE